MFRLTSILFLLIATTLAGNFMILAMILGFGTNVALALATASGAVLAAPLAYMIAQELEAAA